MISADTVSFADGCTFELQLSSANLEDALFTIDTSVLAYGSSQVNFIGLSTLEIGNYMLLDLSSVPVATVQDWNTADISISGLGAGDSFAWSEDGTKLYLVHDVVPEPTTATLSLLALAGLAARRRRR